MWMTTPGWLMDRTRLVPGSHAAETPFRAHGADHLCESTSVILSTGKEFEVDAAPWWLMD